MCSEERFAGEKVCVAREGLQEQELCGEGRFAGQLI